MASAERYRGLGDQEAKVRLSPGVDLSTAKLSPMEGFVLSRVDGSTDVKTLCMLTGLGEDQTTDILRGLREKGLILVGNERPDSRGGTRAKDTGQQRTRQRTPRPDQKADKDAAAEQPTQNGHVRKIHYDISTLPPGEEAVDLKPEQRARIRAVFDRLHQLNLFELFEISPKASVKEIRKAYFLQSKVFHPDRYFNKEIGPYLGMVQEVFKQMNAGHKFLSNAGQLEEYRRMVLQQYEEQRVQTEAEKQAAEVLAEEQVVAEELRALESQAEKKRERGPTVRHDIGLEPEAAGDGATDEADDVEDTERIDVEGLQGAKTQVDITIPVMEEHEPTPGPAAASPQDEVKEPSGSYSYVRSGDSNGDAKSDRLKAHVDRMRRRLTNPKLKRKPKTKPPVAISAVKEPEAPPPKSEDRRRRSQRITGVLFARAKKAQQFFKQGQKQMEKEQYLAASASLKLAHTYNPDDATFKRAYEAAFAKAKEVTAENHFKRGIVEESVGRYDAAAESFMQAADACDKPAYLQKAAEAALWIRDLIKAKDYATRAGQRDPNSPEIRVVSAKVFKAVGMKQNARREAKEALKLDPQNADAKELLRGL
jgi:curved DNA-binding protein CbpA